MNTKKYILDRINSGPLFKHFERDYSVFFLSSMGDTHTVANQPKYGNGGLTFAMMTFKNNVCCYYRLEQDNEVYLKNIADNIAKDTSIKDEIFHNYSLACEKILGIYQQIEVQENFGKSFIENLSKTINQLIPYQILILHRTDSFVTAFEKTSEVPDEIYVIRKKYESAFGLFETRFELLCKKIVKKLEDVTVEDLKCLTALEIIELMEGGKRPSELIKKRKLLTIVNYLPNVEILTGPDTEVILQAIHDNESKYHPSENFTGEIKGKTVFGTGKVIGKCHVISDYDTIEELKEGEILVVPSTLPKYNNVYKRAKAIITDEGSVLAHASIFCREFKITGIVGTKIATKVLKDGDLVEVDADKGIVKIIK
ncbi:MAG: hypothetical protein EXS48_00725 [Candidatus Staskawiczbacteria bacterium]|nr:hypothetical protein [Candidatus Staskawiczbacteria bacterium]